jgi:predicted dehydrogenase
MKIGLIGHGHWGRNYARVLLEMGLDVTAVADSDAARLAEIARRHGHVQVTTDPSEILRRSSVDAVVIATPASTHYRFASAAIEGGKHVLVEKPITLRVEEAERLVELAARRRRVLMVGHTLLYNDAVRALRRILRDEQSGSVYYLTARRNHLGKIREDVSALWDLAPHDVSLFTYLLEEAPEWVSGSEGRFLRPGVGDAAFATLGFPSGVIAHLEVSWVDAHKVRETIVVTSRRRIVFDDLNLLEPIRIYEKGVTIERDAQTYGEFRYLLRDGDIVSPRVEQREPLRNLCEHFVECVANGKTPFTGGEDGLRVVQVLSAVQRSIERRGEPVEIS